MIDISDPAEMVQVDWLNPWNCIGLSWFGSDGHMNEMVSTLGDSLLFVSAGDSEVLVYDITAPDAPTLIGGHILPNDSASTWGVDVHDGTVVGSYINNHGLPFQPYDSKYGGVVIFDWEVTFGTAVEALRTSNMRPRILGNPSSGLVHIQLPPTGEKSIHINVVDIQGRFVRDARIVAEGTVQQLFKLDLTGQADGTYFITVSTPYDRTTLQAVLAGN
ncbi:MAG: T9SS type A sorting domain-containing protein [Flavobacteriales bacterium]|nr:T9SS type A sorting domain-containing protein [Flavobacteriales bacterium]